jgi:streptogrisin D
MKRRLAAAVGLASAFALVVAAPPAGAASSAAPGRTAETFQFPERYQKQVPLQKAAGAIRNEIERGGYAAGYAGVELADDHVVLWWKGALPAGMAKVVAAARAHAPVTVSAATHSLAELRTSGTKLKASYPGARVKYAVDGSKVVLGVASAASLKSAPKADVPVSVEVTGAKVETSRRDDWAPWIGGADAIIGNARCTGGFAVRNSANQQFLLLAGHCGDNGNQVRDGAGEVIGTFTGDNPTHDLGLVATNSVDNQMYVGGLDSNAITNVDGWDWVFAGEYLCQSGGSSARDIGGPVCTLRVEKFNTDPGDAIEARQVDGQVAVRGGDSGGPVYSGSAGGGAIAKGINQYTYVGNNNILGFQDFGTATRDYGIWIAD